MVRSIILRSRKLELRITSRLLLSLLAHTLLPQHTAWLMCESTATTDRCCRILSEQCLNDTTAEQVAHFRRRFQCHMQVATLKLRLPNIMERTISQQNREHSGFFPRFALKHRQTFCWHRALCLSRCATFKRETGTKLEVCTKRKKTPKDKASFFLRNQSIFAPPSRHDFITRNDSGWFNNRSPRYTMSLSGNSESSRALEYMRERTS